MMEVLLDIRELLDRSPKSQETGTIQQLAKLSSIVRKP
jgi:ABC-type sugar transport system ATPase subunit